MIKGVCVSLAILLAGCASPVGKKAEKKGRFIPLCHHIRSWGN